MQNTRSSKKGILFTMLTICLFLTVFFAVPKQTEAASGYTLKVNRKTNVITAYKGGVPVRVMLCSTGVNNATPLGTYYTKEKIRWHELDGPVWGQYCTRITGHYLFHSVYYYTNYDKTDLAFSQYKKLGKQASHGCVRISVEDAKWIYDNCSTGTKVVIYESDDVGPLGKPRNVKLPSGVKERWDPTDPDTSNPHYVNRPTIKISDKKPTVVPVGTAYKLKANIKVTDYKGRNITSKLRVNGIVDTTTPGTYYLKYWAQDSKCNYAYKHFTVTVVNAKKPVFMGLKAKKTIKISNKYVSFNYGNGVTAYDKNGKELTSKIKVSFSSQYKDSIKKITGKNGIKYLRFFAPGTYNIKYTVTGTKENGAKKTTQTLKVVVRDNTKVKITNTLPEETIYVGSEYGKTQILNGITASTKFKTLKSNRITYTINDQEVEYIDTNVPGTYIIKYNATSVAGRAAKEVERKVIVIPVPEPEPPVAPEEGTTAPEEGTTAPEEGTTTAPEEGTTTAPEEETTTAPEEGTTTAPEEGTTTVPEESTTASLEQI